MPDNPNLQFFSQLSKAKKILIALPPKSNVDICGTAVALTLFLNKQDKKVEIVSEDDFGALYPFLPKVGSVRKSFTSAQSLAVVVDTSSRPLEELSYHQEQGKVKIFLKSKEGVFSPEEIKFEVERAPFDLAIILGAQSLEDLGGIFEANADVFYDTVKVNIDNHPGNTHFGAINLVDINSSSLAELATSLLQEFETDLFDEDIATCLLSGIIAKTRSFQHAQVSPKAFLKAGDLVAKGARQQEIVRALFKTKPLPFLRLWGRCLTNLKDKGEWAFAALSPQDFTANGGSFEFLLLVFKELLENLESKMLVALMAKDGANTKLFLAARKGLDLGLLTAEFGATGKELKNISLPPFGAWEFNLPETLSFEELQKKLETGLEKLFKQEVS